MAKEEKELLKVKDLCARLPYGVKCKCLHSDAVKATSVDTEDLTIYYFDCDEWESIEYCKPYLRPMSSMTEEEDKEYMQSLGILELIHGRDAYEDYVPPFTYWKVGTIDFFNAHHFDYRGLIEKGLALEAPKGMYK